MVFISHCMLDIKKTGYIFVGGLDAAGMHIRSELGQLVVVMFLFYSGYGVMESYAKKGRDYVKSFPKKRILTTLLNFDIAVLAFVILDVALGIKLGLKQIVLSLTAWESVGNSNWYIFVILFCYFVAYVSFLAIPGNGRKAMWMVSILVLAGMIVLSYLKPSRWYNTILCFPAGMCLSAYKDRIMFFCKKHYIGVLTVSFVVIMVFHWLPLPRLHGIVYNVQGVAFALLTVLLTMKVKTGNVVLHWLGVNLFPIYIYQRIPMIAITKFAGEEFVRNYPYVFMVSCFVVTSVIVWGYKFWRIRFS